jgi:hypothetical protein
MLVPIRAFRRPRVNRSRALGQAAAQLMLILCGDDIPEQRAQLTAVRDAELGAGDRRALPA